MRKHRRQLLIVSILMMSLMLMVGCGGQTEPEPVVTEPVNIKLVDKDGESHTIDLNSLEAVTVQGGFRKVTGTLVGPENVTGPRLKDVLDKMGGITADQALEVIASDGYTMTLSYEQAQGHVLGYDQTGQALKVEEFEVLLIMKTDGEALTKGFPRLAFVSDDGLLSDGHFWVKDIDTLKIVPAVVSWEIEMDGIETVVLDRSTFESMATCPDTPHPAVKYTTTTKEGNEVEYEGMGLWVLVSMIDGGDAEGGHYLFNDELADKGYTIEVVASDGFSVEFSSEDVKRNDDIIVAYKVNGEPLPESDGPLRIVGPELPSKKHGIKQIAQIKLANLPE